METTSVRLVLFQKREKEDCLNPFLQKINKAFSFAIISYNWRGRESLSTMRRDGKAIGVP